MQQHIHCGWVLSRGQSHETLSTLGGAAKFDGTRENDYLLLLALYSISSGV